MCRQVGPLAPVKLQQRDPRFLPLACLLYAQDSLLPRVTFLLSHMDLSDGHSFGETFS